MTRTAICLHSGGFTSRQWRRLAKALAPTHEVLTPDLLGYGTSGAWPDGKPFHFQEDVDAIVALANGREVDLVGHSYGGFIACHVARHVRVHRMALYEPVTFAALDLVKDADAIASLSAVPDRYTDDPEAWLAGFVNWWNGVGAWQALPDATKQDFRAVGWKLSEEVRTLATDRTDFSTITAPTLVMSGSRSPLAERRTVERLVEVMPNAVMKTFDGVGHMAPITHQALVDGAIESFFYHHVPRE
ncbi:MAG TPA: alpha/beta fold hydrolase [Kofleriaceae bacterium]|jgi:pimeloyl-ACP methyl ester carboxylesterase